MLKNTEARMNKDGLEQTIYQVVGRIETSVADDGSRLKAFQLFKCFNIMSI